MKGFPNKRSYLGRLFGLLFIVANLPTLSANDHMIVVVKSNENNYFNQTVLSLINQVEGDSRFIVTNTEDLDSVSENLENANIVVTLGASAASQVSSQSPNQLVINAYITLEQAEQFRHYDQDYIAVLLNQPLERYLAFSHYLLNLKSLGTINHSDLVLSNRQRETLEKIKLRFNQYRSDDTNKNLLSTLRQLLNENEALLMLPEQSIYNRDTLKGILLTSYRNRTPVISYSPGHVKSGALAAIYSSPANIGRHLANLINKRHQGKLKINNNMIYAEYFSIAKNQRVARSLGLNLPDEEKIRQLIDGLAE